MSNNTKYVRDAFKSLDLVEDKEFDLTGKDSFQELDDFIEDDDVQVDTEVIDLDAETEEELKDSYVGDAILSCPVCHTNLFKVIDDIVIDEETELCNVGEPCPICGQEDGFKIIGKVAPFEEVKETEVEVETEPDDAEVEVKEKVRESFKKKIADKKLQEQTAKRSKRVLKENKNLKEDTKKVCPDCGKEVCECDEKQLVETPVYDLNPQFDSRQSFYGKAKVDTGDKNDKNRLYSYNTLVAEIKDGKPIVYGTYSQTTLRHIKDWLKQNGFKADNAKQIIADYGVKDESCKRVNETIITEAKAPSVKEIAKFLEDSIKAIEEDPSVTARYVLDDDLCLYVGYEGGFDKDETGNDERICAKIAERNDYYWVDFEAMNMPWDPETGDVWDTDSEVSPSDAKYYIDEYKNIRKALDKGDVVLESKKSNIKGKELKEEVSDHTVYDIQQEIERIVAEHFKGTDFFVSVDEIDLDQGILTLDVSAMGGYDEETGEAEELNRKVEIEIPSLALEDTLGEKLDQWMADHSSPDWFYESKQVNEAIENATIETEDQVINLSAETKEEDMNADWFDRESMGEGELLPDGGEEMIAPLDDADIQEIKDAQETEEEETEETLPEDEEEFEFDEIQEESFKRSFKKIAEKYLLHTYSNIKSFDVDDMELAENLLKVDGTIGFNSGKTKKTTFVFEAVNDKSSIAKFRKKFVGLNETFTDKKDAYILKATLNDRKLFAESLRYDYPAKTKDLTESVKTVKGFVK